MIARRFVLMGVIKTLDQAIISFERQRSEAQEQLKELEGELNGNEHE